MTDPQPLDVTTADGMWRVCGDVVHLNAGGLKTVYDSASSALMAFARDLAAARAQLADVQATNRHWLSLPLVETPEVAAIRAQLEAKDRLLGMARETASKCIEQIVAARIKGRCLEPYKEGFNDGLDIAEQMITAHFPPTTKEQS